MYVRWLGAFRKNGSLSESINFELTRNTPIACEQLVKSKSNIQHARVGLLVDPKAVYKRYYGDVYSEYTAEGTLYRKRAPYEAHSNHKEAWTMPVYTGIVIKNGSFSCLSAQARREIRKSVYENHLPVYRLVKGRLIPETM